MTCRFCSEAFRMTSTARSFPISWSTSLSGILTSAVLRKSTLLIQESTGGNSSGTPAVSTMFDRPRALVAFEYTSLLLKHFDLEDRNERAERFSRTRTRDHLREFCERALDVVARLRRREHPGSAVGFGGSLHVGLLHRHLFSEVRFVREVLNRNVARDLHDGRDPFVEVGERLLPRDVAHREDALGAVEVRFLQQFTESLLAHDVPDRHVDRALPDEADFDLHSLAVHGSPRTGCVALTRLRL